MTELYSSMAQPVDHVVGISAPPVLTHDDKHLDRSFEGLVELFNQMATPAEGPDSDPSLLLSRLLNRNDFEPILNAYHPLSDLYNKLLEKYGCNFAVGLRPPQDGRAAPPPSPAFAEEPFSADPRALPTGAAGFKRILPLFGLGTDSGFDPPHPQDDTGGITALLTNAGVDLELGGSGISDTGGIPAPHILRAERYASYNDEVLFYEQWRDYIKDLKIVNSGASDSMLVQPVITLLGEAFGGALAHALGTTEEPSQVNSIVQAGILMGVGLSVTGIGLNRFNRRLSDKVMKAGAMGTALAITVAFAGLLPPWLAWSVGPATSILVATGIAII